jgi:hypothetical protein
MKISFPSYSSGTLLTRKQGASSIISSIIIGLFAGIGGGYFLENNFALLTIAVLGIAGILLCLGGAVDILTLLSWSKVERARSTPIKKNTSRITSEWHYRPRKAIRRLAAVDSATAETSEILSPEPFAINNNGWCNDDARERTAHTFIDLDPTVEDETAEAPLLGRACAVSAYD